jgi:hypothetical protein
MRRVCIIVIASFGFAAAAAAQPPAQTPAPEPLTKVYACAAIAEAQARLACFDAAVAALKSAETQGDFAAVDAARVRQMQRESFGFTLPSLPKLGLPGMRPGPDGVVAAPVPDEQTMRIARLGRFDGRSSFVMENGQVWVLVESKSNRNARAGASVTIRRALMGSFLMSVEKGGAALRVRRVE